MYLINEHARGHGEARPWGEVTGDHDPHASLGEGQLVGVRGQQLIHHQDRRLTVEVSCGTRPHQCRSKQNKTKKLATASYLS